MTNTFIIHGFKGYPEENWFPWLRQEVEKRGHKAFVPQFPTPENQTLKNWLQVIREYSNDLNEESVVIGHSLGVSFLLNVIENQPVKTAFLVAGFTGITGNEFDDSMKTFARRAFNWKQIKENCKKFHVFHSNDDPYIKIDKAKELAENLETELTLIENAGHFNSQAGYDTFDLLLEKIQDEL